MTDWNAYYQKTKDLPPSPLLLEALPYVAHRGKAIDIGSGALKDTRYLLEQGFEVTSIDKESSLREMATFVQHDRLQVVVAPFADYTFPEGVFDLASAMFALPFNPPETFDRVFTNIKLSIRQNGIFCGQLFGTRDEWIWSKHMTFHTKEQVEQTLSDLEIIKLDEREYDGVIASGEKKHWHVFHIIAKRA